MDFATLYEQDVETWAELQIKALRRLASTSGPWTNAIDWENVIEEVEDLGSDQRRAVESLLENAFAHALKIATDPDSLSAEHWKREVKVFLDQARAKMRPAMRRRIDMDKIWQDACRQASNALEAFDRTLPDVPKRCPCSFDEVIEGALESYVYLRLLVLPEQPQQ
jgi:hypothetical protein